MTVFLFGKSGIVVPKFVTDLIEESYFGRNVNAGDGSKSKIRLKKEHYPFNLPRTLALRL